MEAESVAIRPREVVIFGVGSPLVADLEEGLRRAGIAIAAAVANVPGEVHLLDRGPLIDADALGPELAALPYLVPLFTPANRHTAALEAERLGLKIPLSFLDPSVVAPASLHVDPGAWVNTGVTLGAAGRLGRFALVNRGSSLGHHARIGEFASVGPGAVLAGQVTLGAGATVGAGAVVLPELTVGSDAAIAAGSVVTRDVPDNCLAVGNPAEVVRESLPGFDAARR